MRSLNYKNQFIATKLIYEIRKGKFLCLAVGDIRYSEADVVVVSTFTNAFLVKNSAIGAVNELYRSVVSEGNINSMLSRYFSGGSAELIDMRKHGLGFKRLLVIGMGGVELLKNEVRDANLMIIENIRTGLKRSAKILSELKEDIQLDVALLGTQYGDVNSGSAFDVLSDWSASLMKKKNIRSVRLVAYDIDVYTDFFESLYRMKHFDPEDRVNLSDKHHYEKFGGFDNDVNSARESIVKNPTNTFLLCRKIIEQIAYKLCSPPVPGTLNDAISSIKDKVPVHIHTYLNTCRILGNHANHTNIFNPSSRDSEIILELTLRIVSWYLENSGDN
jgi:hypothetical protein